MKRDGQYDDDGAKERDSEVDGYFRKVKEGHDEREEQKKKSDQVEVVNMCALSLYELQQKKTDILAVSMYRATKNYIGKNQKMVSVLLKIN